MNNIDWIFDNILATCVMLIITGVAAGLLLFYATEPETNVTTIRKQDRLPVVCRENKNLDTSGEME